MKKTNKPKLIAILGATASGKSDLAVCIARKFNGEVISVDSRQVYRGLDIGSGKITKTEMKGVPHHLLDVANPKKVFTANDFIAKGNKAIYEILKKGKVPILAGGTGFYLSALLGDVSFPNVKPNKKLRTSLEKLSNKELISRLKRLDPKRAEEIDQHNTPRIIRAIEIAYAIGKTPKSTPRSSYEVLKIGIDVDKEILEKKINGRLISRLRKGMLAEARTLHKNGLTWKRMESLGLKYRYMALHLKGDISKEEMIEALKIKIRQYAKRQKTWFKRDKKVKWFTLNKVGRFKLTEIQKIEKEIISFLAP